MSNERLAERDDAGIEPVHERASERKSSSQASFRTLSVDMHIPTTKSVEESC